jgi:hypothetical protein
MGHSKWVSTPIFWQLSHPILLSPDIYNSPNQKVQNHIRFQTKISKKIKNVGHLKPYKRATPLLSLPLSPPIPFLLE